MTKYNTDWTDDTVDRERPIVSILPCGDMILSKAVVAAHDIRPGARAWLYTGSDYSDDGTLPFTFVSDPRLDGHPLWFTRSGEVVILGAHRAFERYEHYVQDYVGRYQCQTFSAAEFADDDPYLLPEADILAIDLRKRIPLPPDMPAEPEAHALVDLETWPEEAARAVVDITRVRAQLRNEVRAGSFPTVDLRARLDQLVTNLLILGERENARVIGEALIAHVGLDIEGTGKALDSSAMLAELTRLMNDLDGNTPARNYDPR